MTDEPEGGYSHAGHGEMTWKVRKAPTSKENDLAGWCCERCHVMAPPERADDVFDEHDCDEYADILGTFTGGDS